MTKKYIKFLLGSALALSLNTKAQTTFTQNWVKETGINTNVQSAVKCDGLKNTYVAGSTKNIAGNYDIIVTKISPYGATLWQYIYTGEYGGDDIATGIFVEQSTSKVYVTGSTYEGTSQQNNIITIALNTNGTENWVKTFDNEGTLDYGADIIVFNNAVYVGGSLTAANNGLPGSDFCILKYQQNNGIQQWFSQFSIGNADLAMKMVNDGWGNFTLSGVSQTSTNDWCISALSWSDATSTAMWTDFYQSASIGTGFDKLNMSVTDANNNIYLVGAIMNEESNYDMRTIKLNQNLDVVWIKDFAGISSGDDVGNDIKVDAIGNVYVCGYTTMEDQGKNYNIIKYSPNGDIIWRREENGAGNSDDIANSLCLTDDGSVSVTGIAKNTNDKDYYTLRYCPWGTKIGSVYYNGSANQDDEAKYIYLQNDTTLIVSGTTNSNNKEYTTISYKLNFATNNLCTIDTAIGPPNEEMIILRYNNQKEVTIGSDKYFQFDIEAKSNHSYIHLNSTEFYFKYPLALFGNNPIANGLLTASLYSNFSTNYSTVLSMNPDLSVNTKIQYNNNTIPINRVLIDSLNFKKLIKISIKINNLCDSTITLIFPNILAHQSNYTHLANEPTNLLFTMRTKQPNNVSAILCQANISSFEPETIRAGVGDTLIIKGYNLANGNCRVRFKEANNGGNNYTGILNSDNYFAKTDTLIKLTVPSQFKTGGTISNSGTGKILVEVLNGSTFDTLYTNQELNIKYSITNYVDMNTSDKYQFYLQKTDTTAYVFHCDAASVSAVSGAKDCIKKAIDEWKCHTHANIRLGNDVSNSNDSLDGFNVIRFTSSSLTSLSAFADTKVYPDTCSNHKSYVKESDIRLITNPSLINSNLQHWFVPCWQTDITDTVSLDFYEIILHELGHALALSHVINTNELMHYTSKGQGQALSSSQRLNLNTTTTAVEGVVYTVQNSAATSIGCGLAPMVEQNSVTCTVAIEENTDVFETFTLFPNPNDGNFKFSTQNQKLSNYQFYCYDLLGNECMLTTKITNDNLIEFELQNNSSGIYFFRVKGQSIDKSFKIIKQ